MHIINILTGLKNLHIAMFTIDIIIIGLGILVLTWEVWNTNNEEISESQKKICILKK